MKRRRGVSTFEVLVSVIICAALGLPVLTLLATGAHEAAVSEDYMFAEPLAQRYLAEVLAIPLDELKGQVPLRRPIEGLPAEDEAFGDLRPEYAQNLAGPCAVRGAVTVRKLREGLFVYEVVLRWPVRPGARTLRTYAVMRFRTCGDLSITSEHGMGKAPDHPCWRRGGKMRGRGVNERS